MTAIPPGITQLLAKWSSGDKAAFDELIPLVYPELRRLARIFMGREDSGHTLQTSALINEAYLRLVNQQEVDWEGRAHFFAVASQVMRHILVDHARRYRYSKRGGGQELIPLNELAIACDERAVELIALDDALTRLAAIDERKSKIVELRFFGGLTVEETAQVMKLAPITVMREWRAAKAWLGREISQDSET
jgi:RNA polymerase sigma factor (TIGR02999 family)